MTVMQEGEIRFVFDGNWSVSRLDLQGVSTPHGMAFVDFVAENDREIVLIEVKNPAASQVEEGRRRFADRLHSQDLVNEHLVPKARDSYTYLHLMRRDGKRMRFVLALGLEGMSVQPPLLAGLNDRLRRRLRQEADQPWSREYMEDSAVVPIERIDDVVPGCSVVQVSG